MCAQCEGEPRHLQSDGQTARGAVVEHHRLTLHGHALLRDEVLRGLDLLHQAQQVRCECDSER